MAAKNFESLLEYIVNGEQGKAEELFHQLVVAKSREIYENLLDEEMEEEEDLDEAADEEEEELDEAAEDEDEEMDESAESDDEDMEEMFNFEGDDEDDSVGGDGDASDMEDELGPDGETDDDGMEFGDEDHDEGDEGQRIADLEDALEDLKAQFQQMLDAEEHEEEENPDIHGGMLPDDDEEDMCDEGEADEMMMPFEEEIEAIDLSPGAMMREYVDKVSSGHGAEKKGSGETGGTNTKSTVAGKNDMGGTAKNIAQGGSGTEVFAGQGQIKGNGLMGGKPKDMNTGNVNKVGGTNVKQFYKSNTKGHGAEKKGAGEVGGTDKKSLLGK